MVMKSFQDMKVWNKAYELVLQVYKVTKGFPQEERFGLTQQMRRAAVSIIANIAEGNKRRSDKDFRHFLNISEGSLEETKCYLILSKDLGYQDENTYQRLFNLSEEIGRMLQGFVKALNVGRL